MTAIKDWHQHRHQLRAGDCFHTDEGVIVRLIAAMSADNAEWLVRQWGGNGWAKWSYRTNAAALVARATNPEDEA